VANVSVQSSAEVFQNSSSFFGADYATVIGPLNIGKWNNFTITLVNNGSDQLESGSIEVSPNSNNWEVIDDSFFAGLAAGAMSSSQYTESSYRYLRVRAITSGSGGALTGSIDAYVSVNNG